jgi:hypothetical protein
MNIYKGTIIEQSLTSTDVLKTLKITKTWTDEDWVLHDIEVDEELVSAIQQSLADGPWYVHLWRESEMLVIFKEKIFSVNRLDTTTWREAIDHGLSKGIPKGQLDFLTK